MKKFRRYQTTTLVTMTILLCLGVVGGVILPGFPLLGGFLIVIGLVGSVWSLISSESRYCFIEDQLEVQSALLWKSGAGNPYYQQFLLDIRKYGSSKRAVEHLRKACELDPNDADAVVFLAAVIILELSARQGITHNRSVSLPEIDYAKRLANKAMKLNPLNSLAHDAMGILLDVVGRHKEARKEFSKAGSLGSSMWRFELSTSWGLEGNDSKALEEEEKAVDEAKDHYWMYDFYHGRALVRNGRYAEAIPLLLRSYKIRGIRPELGLFISEAFYMTGSFFAAAFFKFRVSLVVIPVFPGRGGLLLLEALLHFVLAVSCRVSKIIWPLSRRLKMMARFHMRVLPPYEPEAKLAEILWDKQHLEWGSVLMERAVSICPEEPRLWANLSGYHLARGKFDEALTAIEFALQSDPDNECWQYDREQIIAVKEGRTKDLKSPPQTIEHARGRKYSFRDISLLRRQRCG